MRVLIIVVFGVAVAGFGCGESKKKSADDNTSHKKTPDKPDTKTRVAPDKTTPPPTGCQSDKDCKGYRICENGQCVEQKKPSGPRTSLPAPPKTRSNPPGPATSNGAGACGPFITAICDSCGSSSSMCTTLRAMLKATSGIPAAMATMLCQQQSAQVAKLESMPAADRKAACALLDVLFQRLHKQPGGKTGP